MGFPRVYYMGEYTGTVELNRVQKGKGKLSEVFHNIRLNN